MSAATDPNPRPHEIERLLAALKRYSPGYLYPIVKLFAETGAKVTEVVQLYSNKTY